MDLPFKLVSQDSPKMENCPPLIELIEAVEILYIAGVPEHPKHGRSCITNSPKWSHLPKPRFAQSYPPGWEISAKEHLNWENHLQMISSLPCLIREGKTILVDEHFQTCSPYFSHICFSIRSMGFSWISMSRYIFPIFSHHFPTIFPSFSHIPALPKPKPAAPPAATRPMAGANCRGLGASSCGSSLGSYVPMMWK